MSNLIKTSTPEKRTLSAMRKSQLVAVAIGIIVTLLALLVSLYPHNKMPRSGDDFQFYPQDIPAIVVSYPTMLLMKSIGLNSWPVDVPALSWLLIGIINCLILFLIGTLVGAIIRPTANDS